MTLAPDTPDLLTRLDPDTGAIDGRPVTLRRLSDLRGCFRDAAAFERRLAQEDSLVYSVCAVEARSGEGDLHYGLGVIQPGRVGDEYFLTKGHLHTWRAAAEVYLCLAGEGAMLLEDDATGESRLVPMTAHSVIYVPGHTAHRTMNTGQVPLVYVGVYCARAGHDYGALASRNFRSVVVERDGLPVMLPRST